MGSESYFDYGVIRYMKLNGGKRDTRGGSVGSTSADISQRGMGHVIFIMKG